MHDGFFYIKKLHEIYYKQHRKIYMHVLYVLDRGKTVYPPPPSGLLVLFFIIHRHLDEDNCRDLKLRDIL
jgi:hypothetical protein